MTSIITGDIINSRKVTDQKSWIQPLKKIMGDYGKTPKTWEIFRGDSFQLEIEQPEESFMAALKIKAAIRSVKGLDVRMAIGIGEKTYDAIRISESNGDAFVNSGEKFEELKKIKQRLALKSPWEDIDKQLNLMITLASIAMNTWSATSAQLITLSLRYHTLSQKELGKKIKRTQSSVSERQTRAHYGEIIELEKYFRQRITEQKG
ncbi:MAG TPA: SatD family protein [Flavitalea sp.]|nr:SatD family protein [Flavitalea sp.]HTF28369.1 SatD family protein [Flavitalea sp.]